MRQQSHVLLLVAPAACAREESHGDPPCAFDETACLPADLLLTVEAREERPSAVLRATSPLEGNSWVQEGIRGRVDWLPPDGTRFQEEQSLGTVVFHGTPGSVAPRIELSLDSDADRVSVQIACAEEPDPGSREVFREVPLGAAPSVVALETGIYVLRVRASWSHGEGEFFFAFRRV